MRLKVEKGDADSHKCCFCLHCRTGTLLLGLWHLIVCIIFVGFLLLSTFHPNVLLKAQEECSAQMDGIYLDGNTRTDGDLIYSYDRIFKRQWTKEDLCVAFAITVCSLMITLLMIYGTIKSRPSYLMPFFCLQVFGFCLGCLTVVGYFSYAPNVKIWLQLQCLDKLPGMDRLMKMDEQWLMLLFVLVFLMALSVKAYFIGVVWSCYKFLQKVVVSHNNVREYNVDPDTEMLLPPKYEDAIQSVNEEAPPPPYSAQ